MLHHRGISTDLQAEQRPVQLPMFMKAGELLDSLTATIDRSHDDPDDVMASKLVASKRYEGSGHGAGVHASVAREGVLNPVQMIHAQHGNVMMGQGHHRAAAAAEIERRTGADKWVPVVHTDARESSQEPISIYSDIDAKKRVVADHKRWSEHTAALGQDVGWAQRQADKAGPGW